MNLIDEEESREKPKTKKKLVLGLLIFSILLLICVLGVLMVIEGNNPRPKQFSLLVNDEGIAIKEDLVIVDAEGNTYVSLKDLSGSLGEYTYKSGEYGKIIVEKNKGNLENSYEVIGFEEGSSDIYKINKQSEARDQYYTLSDDIISNNDKLYINIKDIEKAFAMPAKYDETKNQLSIYTNRFLADSYKARFEEEGSIFQIDENFNNIKTIVNDKIILVKSGKYGIYPVDNFENPIVEAIFNEILYDEYTENYIIATGDGKKGILNLEKYSEGKFEVFPRYEDIKIVNYSPLLYLVKANNKYGILNGQENFVADIAYDLFGSKGNTILNKYPAFIIPDIGNGEKGIVAYVNNKYGIINLSTHKEIGPFKLDNIYMDENGEYFIEVQEKKWTLQEYLDAAK